MKELSLNILDIAENSVKAGSCLTEITVDEDSEKLRIIIKDNGCGMDKETLKSVTDPFYTTRKTRKVGLGIPFFKMEAEQTGGSFRIESKSEKENKSEHGTEVFAEFIKSSIDFIPLGDTVSTVTTLILGHPERDFVFKHKTGKKEIFLDTREIKDTLDGVPIDTYEVIKWIKDFLTEQYENQERMK